jgi:hypothetical protein
MLHLFADGVANPTPLEWVSSHLHLIGWPAIVFIAWQAGTFITSLKTKITKTVDQIDSMATNHFPHMEASLAKQDIYLESIEKNIGRMADKL